MIRQRPGPTPDMNSSCTKFKVALLILHRHSFELTQIGGKATAGVVKDVVMLGGFQELSFDFVADNPGLTLFHCHQQLHMDFGFMALFEYA